MFLKLLKDAFEIMFFFFQAVVGYFFFYTYLVIWVEGKRNGVLLIRMLKPIWIWDPGLHFGIYCFSPQGEIVKSALIRLGSVTHSTIPAGSQPPLSKCGLQAPEHLPLINPYFPLALISWSHFYSLKSRKFHTESVYVSRHRPQLDIPGGPNLSVDLSGFQDGGWLQSA